MTDILRASLAKLLNITEDDVREWYRNEAAKEENKLCKAREGKNDSLSNV